MENYVFLKSRIMKNCTESEYIVLNHDDEIVRSFAQKTKAKIIWFSVREHVDGAYLSDGAFYYCGERICAQDEFVLDGLHNGANALAAIAVAKIMGIETPAIVKGLKQFQGVAHRIQRVGEINGVTFVNDSKATNVDSTVKAIGCMRKETVLMLGGKDKGYSYEPLFEEIKKSSVVHVVLYGENAFRILTCALKSGFTAITLCREFDMAVRIAYLTARNGQTLLLSPASASFDAFSNYEERGNRFVAIYDQMKTEYERIAEKVGGSECEESGAQLSCDKE
jgi:UDP-N-acetylmuramoylalanine--D-glutamate ligase